jgi:hypothetical protein
MPRGSKPGEHRGGRKPGTPNKATRDIRELAQVHSTEAVKELAKLAGLVKGTKGAESEPARIAALKELLDRGHGKATQAVDLNVQQRDIETLSDAELEAIIRAAGGIVRKPVDDRFTEQPVARREQVDREVAVFGLAEQIEAITGRRVRTLHALGNDVLRRAGGNTSLIDEWEMRRRIEALVPVKPRANTDMYAPYLEALSEVRLGLVDPNVVEAQRDDVAGFGAMFDEYRDKLHADRAIDHDEQIYGAIEALLRAPEIRREFQREGRHLLVDEFQDLTPAQLLLLRLIAAPARSKTIVGVHQWASVNLIRCNVFITLPT